MRNMVVMRRILVGALAVLAQTWFVGQVAAATFEFSSPSSKLVLGDYNGGNGSSRLTSRFRTTAPNSVIGWDQQSIVRGSSTSNVISWAWTTSLGFATHSESSPNPGRDLLLTTSDALNKHWPTIRTTSNWVNRYDNAVQGTSNTVNNLFPIVRGNSQWISNQVTALGEAGLGRVARTTSNWVNAKDELLRTTSNAVNDLAGDTVVLRTTSNFVNAHWPTIRTTSNWVNRYDNAVQGTSNTVNNLFPIVRGSSQWINNQVSDLGEVTIGRLLRTSSNALLVTNEVAFQAKGLAIKAQNRVTGLGQASAQNALDFTSTSTAAFTYTMTGVAASSQLRDAAWHPTGNVVAFAHDFGGDGAVSVNYYNALFTEMAVPYTSQDLVAGDIPKSLAWSPSGTRLLVGADNRNGSARLYLYYYYNNDNAFLYNYGIQNGYATINNNNNSVINQVAWSNDGRYFAVVGRSLSGTGVTTKHVQIYKATNEYYYNSQLTPVASYKYDVSSGGGSAQPEDSYVSSVSWHPNDSYLAIGGYIYGAEPEVQVLKFDGSSLTINDNGTLFGSDDEVINAVAWDPTGTYVAVGGNATERGAVYEFNPTLPLTSTGLALLSETTAVTSLAWSRDGNFVVFGHNGVNIYSFKDAIPVQIENKRGFANAVNAVDWTNDGRYLALSGKNLTADGKDFVLLALSTDIKVSSLGDANLGDTVRTTSNWVNAQYDALGDNRAGYFLRTTSNAMSRYAAGQVLDPNLVRTTSNWVAKQVADLGGSQGLGLMVRATSNWVVEQDLDFGSVREIGEELRTTSHAVNSMWPTLRTSSNWIAKQAADLGVSTVGEYVRTNSNSLVYAHRRINSAEADLSGIHTTLSTIDIGVGDVNISSGTAALSYGLTAAQENNVVFGSSTTLEGKGNIIDFAWTSADPNSGTRAITSNVAKPVFRVETGAFVTLYDTVLRGFNPAAVLINGEDPSIGGAKQARLTIGNGCRVELAQNVTLNRDIICTGEVVIKGYGCRINFAGYKIRIGKGVRGEKGRIIFEDVILDNAMTDSILVAEDSATVVLRDTRMNLSAPYTFNKGALRVEQQVMITGQNVFSFTSSKTLTVGTNATLNLAANSSFVYAPSTGSRTALVLEDATSELVFGGCFFYAPAPGLQLTTGVLTVLSNNNLYNVGATSLDEAITLGDGTTAGDLLIDIQPGATLNIIEGKLDYKSV